MKGIGAGVVGQAIHRERIVARVQIQKPVAGVGQVSHAELVGAVGAL